MTRDELIAELEAATDGSRELSDAVLRACGWYIAALADGKSTPSWRRPNSSYVPGARPDPTRSIYDALSLASSRWELNEMFLAWGNADESASIFPAIRAVLIALLKMRYSPAAAVTTHDLAHR